MAESRIPEDWARPVVHWEIEAKDAELLRAFYGDLFNWKIGDGFIMDDRARDRRPRAGSGRSHPAERAIGGDAVRPGGRPRRFAREIGAAGATVVAEPFDVPGGPTLAGITDPEGNPVMLVQA